jgi:hypothetical protein
MSEIIPEGPWWAPPRCANLLEIQRKPNNSLEPQKDVTHPLYSGALNVCRGKVVRDAYSVTYARKTSEADDHWPWRGTQTAGLQSSRFGAQVLRLTLTRARRGVLVTPGVQEVIH